MPKSRGLLSIAAFVMLIGLILSPQATASGLFVDVNDAVDAEATDTVAIIAQLAEPQPVVVIGAISDYEASLHEQRILKAQDQFLASLDALGITHSITETDLYTAAGQLAKPNRFTYLLNAIGLRVPASAIPIIESVPNVSFVEVDEPLKLHLDQSVKYINASDGPGDKTIFSQSGGPAERFDGTGQVIAVLDSGVDSTHPMFDARFTDAVFGMRTGDLRPVRHGGEPFVVGLHHPKIVYGLSGVEGPPSDELGHGTHVAADAAGLKHRAPGPNLVPGDIDDQIIEGVAPGALLLSYKVCGAAGLAACVGAAALSVFLEDAVSPTDPLGFPKPRATVINMSLGDSVGNPNSASAVAASNAVLAGAVAVASAGNAGNDTDQCPAGNHPCENSVGSPSAGKRVVSVAATNDPGAGDFANELDVLMADSPRYTNIAGVSTGAQDDAGQPVAPEDIEMKAVLMLGSSYPDFALGQHFVYAGFGLPTEMPAAVNGRIALIERGGPQGWGFAQKAATAAASGAVAVLVFNNVPGELTGTTGASTIPMFGISQTNGQYLRGIVGFQSPTFDPSDPATYGTISKLPLRIDPPQYFASDFSPATTGFSSRGPVQNFQYLKPDVTAPGASIYSATVGILGAPVFVGAEGRYGRLSGTSFSGPQTAGAAALLRQAMLDFEGEAPISNAALSDGSGAGAQADQSLVVPPSIVKAGLTNTATNLRELDGSPVLDSDSRSFIHEIGAGLLDVIEAVDARVAMGTNDQMGPSGGIGGPDDADSPDFLPTHSFGEDPIIGSGIQNFARSITVTLENLSGISGGGTYDLSIADGGRTVGDVTLPVVGTTGFSLALSTSSVSVGSAKDDQTTFDVLVSVDGRPAPTGLGVAGTDDLGAQATEFMWWVTATNSSNGETLRMPFYYRAVPGSGVTPPPTGDFTPLTLHFHGNIGHNVGDPREPDCTGDGKTDLIACSGPMLLKSGDLSPQPAASWKGSAAETIFLGANDHTIHDPNWRWCLTLHDFQCPTTEGTPPGPQSIAGPATIEWWASCAPLCAAGSTWNVRLWADGVLAFEQQVIVGAALAGLPSLLSATVNLPSIIANQRLTLHLEPQFLDEAGSQFSIYYDSEEACTPDSSDRCDSRITLPILKQGENQPPSALPDSYPVSPGGSVIGDVLDNDTDPDDPLSSLSLSLETPPANGSVVINPGAGPGGRDVLTYTHDGSPALSDAFDYRVTDPSGAFDIATVDIIVVPECDESFQDDLEPDAESGWVVQTEANLNPASPTWAVTPDLFAHSPTNSWFSDATTLDLKDDRLIAPPTNISSSSHLSFWHRFFFELGSFDGGVLEVSTDGGTSWQDIESAGGIFVGGGYNGTIATGFGSPIAGRDAWTDSSQFVDAMTEVEIDVGALTGPNRLFRWRLAADPLGIGSTPGAGWWVDDIEITETCLNVPPIANDDAASTNEDTPVNINVLGNDSDPDGDSLTVTGATDGSHGSTLVNGDNTITYTPNPNYHGPDSFTYNISDGHGGSDQATVAMTVDSINDPPDAKDDLVGTEKNKPVTFNVLTNDSDLDGGALSLVSHTQGMPGSTTTCNSQGMCTYKPKKGFVGTDSFTYTISDGQGGTDTATVKITIVKK